MPNSASLLQCVDSLVWAPIPPVWVEMRQCNLIGSSTLGHPKFVRLSPGLEKLCFSSLLFVSMYQPYAPISSNIHHFQAVPRFSPGFGLGQVAAEVRLAASASRDGKRATPIVALRW